MKCELALGGCVVHRERQDAPVGKPDAPSLALPAAGLLHHHGGRPMDVIERQPGIRERLLPDRALVGLLGVGFDLLNGLGKVGLGVAELDAAGAALVARKAFLQCLLHRPLQWQVDGGSHRIGVGRDRIDARNRLRLAGDLIDEVKAEVAARPFIRHHGRQRRQSPAGLFGDNDSRPPATGSARRRAALARGRDGGRDCSSSAPWSGRRAARLPPSVSCFAGLPK